MPDIKRIPGMVSRPYSDEKFFKQLEDDAKPDTKALENKVAALVAAYDGTNSTTLATEIVTEIFASINVDDPA